MMDIEPTPAASTRADDTPSTTRPAPDRSASDDAAAPTVRVRNLKKTFVREDGERVDAVDDVSFDVAAGEFVVLLGPSGCGKTTLLRCIAGLEYPDAGSIEILGREDFNSDRGVEVPPERRRLSMVFQTYALWPHFTVFSNVAYPLTTVRSRRPPKSEIRERVHEALRLVGIPNLAEQYPHKLSGGQRQRVALARALVVGSELILFDEPLSNVDAKVRSRLRIDLLDMQQKLGFAALFVTHDQDEAMQLADRIAVMDTGRIAQLAAPTEVYAEPASRYVADFIGSRNEVLGRVVAVEDGRATVSTPLGPIEGNVATPALDVGAGAAVVWRPESTMPSTCVAGDRNAWPVTMRHTMFMGSHVELVAESAGQSILAWVGSGDVHDLGAIRSMSVRPADVRIFAADDADAPVDEA